ESRRLNPTPNHEERPRFSPDGKRLIWTSKATDPTQIWMCDFDSGSGVLVGKPHQLTNLSTGADGAIWSPEGKNIVFVSAVYPDCKDDACSKQRDEELKKSKVKAKIFSRLFYRHWSAFTEFKRSHLFVVSADAVATGLWPVLSGTPQQEERPTGPRLQPKDLTPGDHDVPPFSLGGQDMYVISPDGQEVAYTSNIDEIEATSTNDEIFVVSISGVVPKKISTSPGADTTPLYSPDGKYLAWRSQARAGFEADKWRLLVQDRQSGKITQSASTLDYSVGSFSWLRTHDIVFVAEASGQTLICGTGVDAEWWIMSDAPHADDIVVGASEIPYFTQQSISTPNEIWRLVNGENQQVTHMNDALLSQIDMQPLESFTFKGANNDEVQGFMVKPPGFDPNKKY